MQSISSFPVMRLLAATVLGTAAFASSLAVHAAESSPAGQMQARSPAMEAQWQQVQRAIDPELVVKLSEEFQQDYPGSRYRQANLAIRAGARSFVRAQQEARLSTEALDDPAGDGGYRADLVGALRGGKDAAYRVALMYRKGDHGLAKNPQRSTQWLRIAAELGNGRASWEVANIYNRDGAMAEAARFEAKAVRDGFRIPPRMPNRGLEY